MTSAATTLFMSQSAVSQAISDLEKYYGVRLFERLSKKIYLTEAGEKLLSYARHMIRMNAEVENEMRSLQKNGSIRIGASVTVGACVLPKLVSRFKSTNLNTHIEVFEDNTEKIETMLLHDEIDIGLVEGEITSSDIINEPFMDDELVLICGVNHPFSKLQMIELYELEQEEFIIREKGSGTRKTFEDAMTMAHITWKTAWTCNNADTIKMAVAEGLGVSVISKRAVENEVSSGILCQKEIKNIEFKRNFKIIYHKNKYFTEQMKHFIDLCTKKNHTKLF
jgi:DNA-binding transcriptional LysR family regulator